MKFLLFLFTAFAISASIGAKEVQEALPFWRQKSKLMQQIRENRRVVVAVDAKTTGSEKKVLIQGVGAVNVPLYFAVEQIQRFEDLSKVSSYFQKVKNNREKGEVYFFIKAFGKQIRFIQQYKWGKVTPTEAQMDWLVNWGLIKGMVGHYKLRKISPTKTEIAIWASMKKVELPIPDFLLNFTLEVIAEKTAQKMRAFIENNYREANKRLREKYGKQ